MALDKKKLRCILINTLLLCSLTSTAQSAKDTKTEDSVLIIITKLTDDKEIYKNYLWLGQYFFGVNYEKEATYLNKAMFTAEQTSDKEFMAKAAIKVVDRFTDMNGQVNRYDAAIKIADKGIQIAKAGNLYNYVAILFTKKAFINRSKADFATALKYNEEAVNYAALSGIDSTIATADISYANTLMAKDESFNAFKKYMNALSIAERTDDNELKMVIYRKLGDFYATVNQKEKAKENYIKVVQLAKQMKNENAELDIYQSLQFLLMGDKDFDGAREYLALFKAKAEKSNNEFTKTRALINEVNLVLFENGPNAASYLRKNTKLISDLRQWGYGAEADKALGLMYSFEKNKDSANYYYQKAKATFKPNEPINNVIQWNMAYGAHLQRSGNYPAAIAINEESLKMVEALGSLSAQKAIRENLDSLYIKSNNKPMEVNNKLVLYKLKDSLEKQQKTKESLNIELDAENKRLEREQKIKEEKLRQKHNLQYMGIAAGILTLFVLLAALGRFRVKPWLIRALGFFSFILLFEFIILLADKEIHHLTHGDPLQILLIKIVLIAILLPLHHWLEHKAIHYLLRHQHNNTTATHS